MTQTHDSPHDRATPRDVPPGPLGMLAGFAWQALLVAGLVSLVLGVLVLAWPEATLTVVGVLFGLYLLFSGVVQLVAAFGTHATTALRVMAFISGALSIGIGWLFRGMMQTVAAASDPAMPARGWQIFLGIVSALAGIVLIVSPLESAAVLTVLGGIWLLVVGATEIITAFMVRSRAKDLPPGA